MARFSAKSPESFFGEIESFSMAIGIGSRSLISSATAIAADFLTGITRRGNSPEFLPMTRLSISSSHDELLSSSSAIRNLAETFRRFFFKIDLGSAEFGGGVEKGGVAKPETASFIFSTSPGEDSAKHVLRLFFSPISLKVVFELDVDDVERIKFASLTCSGVPSARTTEDDLSGVERAPLIAVNGWGVGFGAEISPG